MRLRDSFIKVWKILRIKNMKIIIKLALSYMLTVSLGMLLINSFYYIKVSNYMDSRTMELFKHSMNQAKEAVEYKIDLFNQVEDSIYINSTLQEMLFNENYDVVEKRGVQEKISDYLFFIIENYKSISRFNLYVTNRTIPLYRDYIGYIDTIEEEEWYKNLPLEEDKIVWSYNRGSTENEEEISPETLPEVSASEEADTSGTSISKQNLGVQVTSEETIETEPVLPYVSLVRKLRHFSSNTLVGVLRIDLDIESLFEELGRAGQQNIGWFDIVDEKGNVIYCGSKTMSQNVESDIHSYYMQMPLQHNGKETILGNNRQQYVALFDSILSTGWNIMYVIPMDIYKTDIRSFQITMVFAILAYTALFTVLSWFIATKSTKKVRVLSKSMKQIEEGNFDVQIKSSGNDEIDHLIRGFNTMANKLKELVEKVFSVKIREKELELKALQAQINPHFLYNTLASVSWLGLRVGSKDIANMSNSLAKFYKLSLNKGNNIIKIKDEIDHIKAYMDIQCIRFKNKIRIVYEIDDNIMDFYTVRLTVQPFIENALVHGMWGKECPLTIRLIVKLEDAMIRWTIIDDGVGIHPDRLKQIACSDVEGNRGYGVSNVDQRIRLYFGEQYGIHVFSRLGAGTVITILTGMTSTDSSYTEQSEIQRVTDIKE